MSTTNARLAGDKLRYLVRIVFGADLREGVTRRRDLRALDATRTWLLERGFLVESAGREEVSLLGVAALSDAGWR